MPVESRVRRSSLDSTELSPLLYSFRRCPYAMRARMALRYAGIEVELREILLKDKPAEMLELSSKGTVPVLYVEGEVIDESLDVMLWALSRSDPDDWLAFEDDSLALIAVNDTIFKPDLDGYKYAGNDKDRQRRHRHRAENHLCLLEERLERTSWLSGAMPSLSDIALMPFIRQFANVDNAWFESAPYPRLQAWLSGLIQTPLFKGVMKKYPVWRTGDEITIF